MFKSKRNAFFVVLLLFVIVYLSCWSKKDEKFAQQENSLKFKIGEDFPYHDFLDSSGVLTGIDFSKSEVTIVDFWFNTCPPCIDEMQKFEEVMRGKKVSIVSVSINSFKEWRKNLNDTSSSFQFLQRRVPNWSHYVMKSNNNPKLNNKISFDVQKKLIDDLGVSFYPAYFVVNKYGKIIARPVSAVEYIQDL